MKQASSVTLLIIAVLLSAFYAGCAKDSSITDNGSTDPASAGGQTGAMFSVAPPEIPVPENLAVSVVGHSVTVSWTAIPLVEQYQVVFDDSSDISGVKVTGASVTLPYFVNGVHHVKVRVWRYAPVTKNGGAWTIDVYFTVDAPAAGDVTPPVLAYTTEPAAPNAAGWFNTNVTVLFTASDPESGIASCSPALVIASEGVDRSFTGQAMNTAGLSSTVSGAVNIDKTAPTVSLSASGVQTIAGARYVIIGASVDVNASASDALSGVARSGVTVNGNEQQAGAFRWTPSATGASTFAAYAIDKAGNKGASAPQTIIAAYQFNGWRPPVSLAGKKAYKSGSTLPVKFTVVDANGKPVTSGLDVRVNVGDVSAMAEPDGEGIGQWKAEIVLAGSGTQTVTLSGGITPASLAITVR